MREGPATTDLGCTTRSMAWRAIPAFPSGITPGPGNRAPDPRYRDRQLNTATEEIGQIAMPATALNFDKPPGKASPCPRGSLLRRPVEGLIPVASVPFYPV